MKGASKAAMGLLLLYLGCASRGITKLGELPESKAAMWMPIERPPARVHEVIPKAAAEMGLRIKTSAESGSSWILRRGMRMNYGVLYFRVDVEEIPGQPQWSKIIVYATSLSTMGGLLENGETISKPGELAYRIVTLALTRQP